MLKRSIHTMWKRALTRFWCEERGATTLEWVLLLAAIGIPTLGLIMYGLMTLAGHYGLVTTMNQMPFP
ncbi:MAG: Flp family type IVb pilin [Phycisphaerales bacterium JB063]